MAASAAIGEALRRARGQRSLRSVADAIGIDFTHLSRLEAGERAATPELIQRIARELQVDAGPLLELAAGLPAEVASELADPGLRLALGPAVVPDATRHLLRRQHLAEMAARIQAGAGVAQRLPVDPSSVAEAIGATTRAAAAGETQITVDASNRLVSVLHDGSARTRFLYMHGLAHLVLEHCGSPCDPNYDDAEERDATTLAALLLVPEPEISQFTLAEAGKHDLWEPDGASIIEKAASRFDVPLWLMARRLTEGGRLAQMAEVWER